MKPAANLRARKQAAAPPETRSRTALAIPFLALAGALDSAYLTWIHYSRSQPFCAGVGDCDLVNSSAYAQVMGLPVALIGLGGYLAILGLGLARWRGGASLFLDLALFGLALSGTAYSAYLTYIELFVLQAICIWCVVSALLITAILVLSVRKLLRG